jgi:hypothetical protein
VTTKDGTKLTLSQFLLRFARLPPAEKLLQLECVLSQSKLQKPAFYDGIPVEAQFDAQKRMEVLEVGK